MAEQTVYAQYLDARQYWHQLVLEREAVDQDAKVRLFERLARLWGRLKPNERKCAGMHACIAYHRLER